MRWAEEKEEEEKYRSVSLFSIVPDEPLPFHLAVFYRGRHLVYRKPGQALDSGIFNKFVYRRIHRVYIPEEDFPAYMKYLDQKKTEEDEALASAGLSPGQKAIHNMIQDLKSVTTALFLHEDERQLEDSTLAAMRLSTTTVETILSKPYMQVYSLVPYKANTVADHSLRVSVIATFLCHQLGYVNATALEQVAAAGLLHDIGKTKLELSDVFDFDAGGSGRENEEKDREIMKQHPIVSCDMLSRMSFVPQEVIRIIREHHEAKDGSGYPMGLRGPKLHSLSRVFHIANVFDNLTSTLPGDRNVKCESAAKVMLKDLKGKFDTNILQRSMRILTYAMGE